MHVDWDEVVLKMALFLWGGWKGHEPKKHVYIITPFLKEQDYDVEFLDTLNV